MKKGPMLSSNNQTFWNYILNLQTKPQLQIDIHIRTKKAKKKTKKDVEETTIYMFMVSTFPPFWAYVYF